MTSLINTIDTFLDIQVFIPSKRILPVFRLLGRCVEEKGLPIVSIEHMQMEKEFRNNGIGTIALTYLIDWAEREKKTSVVVNLYWVNQNKFYVLLRPFLNKFSFLHEYLPVSGVRAEKILHVPEPGVLKEKQHWEESADSLDSIHLPSKLETSSGFECIAYAIIPEHTTLA